ncbi:MAG: hypothetical protein MUO67_07530 [Anaerolineales bacterium]|nr:hypothetical protein [Anaerolineales bacterium]
MKNQIKSRDWEALSTYLDGQLSNREHTRLEARLKSDPDLQSALEDLRQTRSVIRSLPKLRVPRNFSLTPEMVGIKRDTTRFIPGTRSQEVALPVASKTPEPKTPHPYKPPLNHPWRRGFKIYVDKRG